ncbi:hypothetical protein KKHFBJBL_02125 [Brevundimonas sp. NIBR11]|nr:hypothetical protein KKHFBJBL_02125 [Brevundimonas sp. NIBR11]
MARILTGLDRKTFAEHVAGAEQAVRAITPRLVESLGGDVRHLVGLCRRGESETFGRCREIGLLALGVVETARLAGRPELAETARGIWEMVDALATRGVWHTDALRLHADALATLMGMEGDAPDGSAIARELSRMREAIGAAVGA